MTQQFENFVNSALDKSLASDVTLPTANKIPVYTGIGRQVTAKTAAELDIAIKSDVDTGLSNKEPTITAGTSAQYFRGDKTWQTLNTDAVPETVSRVYLNPEQKTVATQAASSSQSGYLTSTDWNTFNNKLGLADVRYVFLNDSTTTQTTYTVPASAVTEVGRTIIELSNGSLTSITINAATGTGKVAGDSVNISITGAYAAQVLVGSGATLQGDLTFSYQHQTKTLIYKGSDVWKIVG